MVLAQTVMSSIVKVMCLFKMAVGIIYQAADLCSHHRHNAQTQAAVEREVSLHRIDLVEQHTHYEGQNKVID